jgi:hypothetical protein
MKNLCDPSIAKFRDHEADRLYRTKDNERALGGAFLVPFVTGNKRYLMRVIASAGSDQPKGWRFDHVSVSLSSRTPTWEEMDYVKRLFFRPDEVCYQLHVANDRHINNHPFCLHIWHALDADIPLPPDEMVGTTALNEKELRQGALPGVEVRP